MAMIASFAVCSSTAQAHLDTVRTETGLVSGSGDAVREYLGIPYARAPVGNLRWHAPMPADSWQGIRDGSRFGPDCMQPAEYPELRGNGMSEDCLSVNVWTPAHTVQDRLPVMVWIYGGGFRYGSGSHPSYDGEALASRGVIIVTFNYRMGLLGYMAHPQLTAESPSHSSGNYGLMDQIAALQWVQRNIGAFGGDPQKVTVFGQSAGAHSISTLLVSPKGKGLFRQAIMQSVGVMRPMASLKQAEQYGLQFGADINELRKLPASELITRLQKAKKFSSVLTSPAIPSIIVDGVLVPEPDYKAFATGNFLRVPIIVGTNANEGGGAAKKIPVKTAADLDTYLAKTFAGSEAPAKKAYGVADDAQVRQSLADLYSDVQFRFGTRQMLHRDAVLGVPAYQYVFSRSRNDGTQAPIHGDELQFVFGNLAASHRGKHKAFNKQDEEVSNEMSTAWVNFGKHPPNTPLSLAGVFR
jgi:para-nitrobenzyl esterase